MKELVKYKYIDLGFCLFEYEIPEEVYENVDGIIVLHCNVSSFSASKLKLMRSVFEIFKSDARDRGFNKLVTVTPNPKFAALFGGETKDHFVINDQYVEVMTWELKQP